MPQNETIRDAILVSAERRARQAGYNGFSFREIADDVGIKSASVHYHFPTKADLAREVMDRYRANALTTLGEVVSADEALAKLVELFRSAARNSEMCLCGSFGASSGVLPDEVRNSAVLFSLALAEWLRAAPGADTDLPLPALSIIALLEGALLLSVTARDPSHFERGVAPLITGRT